MDDESLGTTPFLRSMWASLGGASAALADCRETGSGSLPSAFAVSDFASASIAAAGLAAAELISTRGRARPEVVVDRRLASLWFAYSIRPLGWTSPSPWDPIAGDYAAGDGFIRLHTNAPRHRDAALRVLGVGAVKADVEREVAGWQAQALEDAVVAAGGCAAAMRSVADWRQHPQGRCVDAEPLVAIEATDAQAVGHTDLGARALVPERPLQGLRVLDLTRVLAGPVATRLLAGLGAQVLRIDPPDWEEPALAPEVTLGKRCARLDLRDAADRHRLETLLRESDVLVHGYRADALERLGFAAQRRQELRPGLVDVSLDAYGWSGPWRDRRGFDSLVQMSAGIAEAGMRARDAQGPRPLPVQALDHATGYLMAAAALRGLALRATGGGGCRTRLSLARVARLLIDGPTGSMAAAWKPAGEGDWSDEREQTSFGPAQRLRPPLQIAGCPIRWDRGATALGSSAAQW